MARPATGSVVIDALRPHDPAFGIRFRAAGKRRSRRSAARRRAGPNPAQNRNSRTRSRSCARGSGVPQSHHRPQRPCQRRQRSTSSRRNGSLPARRKGLAAKTLADLKWSLSNHLLSFFAGHVLYEITAQEIDRYKVKKTKERQAIEERRAAARAKGERFAERGLSNGSINHTLRHLAQILETAVEYELIASNPAAGRRCRLKATKPARPWVEPEQLMAFLDNAPNRVGQVLLAISQARAYGSGRRSRCVGATSTSVPERCTCVTPRH
jgi:hypothetical protein